MLGGKSVKTGAKGAEGPANVNRAKPFFPKNAVIDEAEEELSQMEVEVDVFIAPEPQEPKSSAVDTRGGHHPRGEQHGERRQEALHMSAAVLDSVSRPQSGGLFGMFRKQAEENAQSYETESRHEPASRTQESSKDVLSLDHELEIPAFLRRGNGKPVK